MSSTELPVPFSTLLTHRDWVRRLARSLVHDDASADDVEQRTWLVALRNPPRDAGSARTWLARVVRSQALNGFRASGRRSAHERAGARGESVRSAGEVVAEAETHNRLVVAVLGLDEPYRSTVLLRFFEDLPPREVAQRMSVPVETVRTRLRRALAALREQLGKGNGADGWIAALAPITNIAADAAAGTSKATAAGIAGGSIMGAKATVAAAVGLVLVAGIAGGRLSASAANESSATRVAELARRVDALDTPGPSGGARSAAAASDRKLTAAGERQAAQERRIEALEADLVAALAAAPKRQGADAELERLKSLSTADLLAETQRLQKIAKYTKLIADAEAVLRASDALLARQLETAQRAEALILKGDGYTVLGDRVNEEASYREALNVAGASSRQGVNAAVALAYAADRRGEHVVAAEWFLSIARLPETKPGGRSYYRYMAGNFLHGDARARDEYRAVIDEFGSSDDKDARKWADFARTELEKLDADGGGR